MKIDVDFDLAEYLNNNDRIVEIVEEALDDIDMEDIARDCVNSECGEYIKNAIRNECIEDKINNELQTYDFDQIIEDCVRDYLIDYKPVEKAVMCHLDDIDFTRIIKDSIGEHTKASGECHCGADLKGVLLNVANRLLTIRTEAPDTQNAQNITCRALKEYYDANLNELLDYVDSYVCIANGEDDDE